MRRVLWGGWHQRFKVYMEGWGSAKGLWKKCETVIEEMVVQDARSSCQEGAASISHCEGDECM
jgi:hypothetical protein